MESQSKIPISTAQVEKIIASHFDHGVRLSGYEELPEGFFNTAAKIELSDGRKMVLKAAPPADVAVMRYEQNIMRAEVESMRLVRQKTCVPVPEILLYDNSKTLLPSEFFMMEYIEGVPFHKLRPQLTQADQYKVEVQMGRMCRQIGEITGACYGLWDKPEPAGSCWRTSFDNMMKGILLDAQDMQVDLEKPLDEVYRIISRHYDVLDEVDTPRLVHWDMWAGNVFVDPQTMQVSGLIDFERVLWGDPLTESFLINMQPTAGYSEGYGEDLLGTPGRARRRRLYDAYVFLIMIIECYFRHYPTNDQENWARATMREIYQDLA